MNVKVAAIQMNSDERVEYNLQAARDLIEEAANQGCQFAVLPEFFCFMGAESKDRLPYAEPFGQGHIQAALAKFAQQSHIWLSAGTIPLTTDNSEKIYNSNLLFDPQGQCVGRYDKIHLFGFDNGQECYRESDTLMAGDDIETFTLPFANVRPSVCYDLRFPELYRKENGYEVITVPAAFTYTTGKAHWEVLLRARAIENQCFVIAAGQTGVNPSGNITFGHSMIVDPWGTVLAQKADGIGVVVAEMDLDRLRECRQQLPALDNRIFD